MITIDYSCCTYCGGCVSVCPMGVLTLAETRLVTNTGCIGCGDCVSACPTGALRLEGTEHAKQEDIVRRRYDVVVVGAGPAGTTTAHLVARAGLSVLLLEKRQEIGSPVRCAEAVAHHHLLPFIEPDPSWIAAKVNRIETAIVADGTTQRYNASSGLGYILERRVFDRVLAERAAQAGVTVRVKTTVTGLLMEQGRVCGVRIQRGDFFEGNGEVEVEAQLVIAADGIEAEVGRWAGLEVQLPLKDTLVCAQYLMAGMDIDPTCAHYTFDYELAPGGYAWIFPKGEGKANVGLAVQADLWQEMGAGPHLGGLGPVGERTVFCRLNRFIESNPLLAQGAPVTLVTGNVPVALPPTRIVADGLVLVGDAARQVNPLTGGGIGNAMLAGRLAAEVAIQAITIGDASAIFLGRYEERWRRSIGRRLEASYRLRERFPPAQRADEQFVGAFLLAVGGKAYESEVRAPVCLHDLTVNHNTEKQKSVDKEIQTVLQQFSRYVDALPAELKALAPSIPLRRQLRKPVGMLSLSLPFWLNEEFAVGTLHPQARQMALANCFGQAFCLLQDRVIDRHKETEPELLIPLNVFFLEFLHSFHKLFSADHPFWDYFASHWKEYAQALAWEKAHHWGRITPYEEEDFLWIGRKLSPLKICCAGMALLADREGEIAPLSRMVEHLHIGYQLLDDLEDWSEDAGNTDYTYPLTLAHLRAGERGTDTPLPDEIERLLWSEGVAAEVRRKAGESLSQAIQDIGHLSLEPVKSCILRIQERAQSQMEKADRRRATEQTLPQVQLFSKNDQHLAFNFSTFALYEIDSAAASLLKCIEQEGWPKSGTEEGLLRELRTAEVFSFLPPPRGQLEPCLTSLYLDVSPPSSLPCSYCSGDEGQHHSESKPISREVGQRAVDLLLRESGDHRLLNVVFCGEEPLLNPELIESVIGYGRQESARRGKQIQFKVITGGTLSSPQLIDLFQSERVSVQINLDIPPEVRHLLRPTGSREKAYMRVVDNIRALLRAGMRGVSIHVTLASPSPSPVDILDHILSLDSGPVQMQHVRPVRRGRDRWREADLPVMMKHQDELAEYFLRKLHEGRVIPYVDILRPLARLCRPARMAYHCSAGVMMGSVTTKGDIYPCHRFSEQPDFAIGSVFSGLDHDQLLPFVRNHVDHQRQCQDCWCRYLCGGDCRYENLMASGDVTVPNPVKCELIRHQFQVIVRLLAQITREFPQLVERLETGAGFPFLTRTRECSR